MSADFKVSLLHLFIQTPVVILKSSQCTASGPGPFGNMLYSNWNASYFQNALLMLNLFATTSKCLSDLSCHLSLLHITLALLMKILRLASSPVSLKLKFACGYGQDGLSISYGVQGDRIPNEDFIERRSLKPHCHARH
jgi:hypothetical protein